MLSPTFLLKMETMVQFVTSTCQLAYGWYTWVKLNLIPLSSQNFLNFLQVNWVVLSVIIRIRKP